MKSKMYNQTKSVKQRFATRKFKKGIVSVLLGFTMIFGEVVTPAMKMFPGLTGHSAVMAEAASDYESYTHSSFTAVKAVEGSKKTDDKALISGEKHKGLVEVTKGSYDTSSGTQEWTITFNNGGISNDISSYTRTNNPRLGFVLSEDLAISGEITFSIISEDGNSKIENQKLKDGKLDLNESGGINLNAIENFKEISGQSAVYNYLINRNNEPDGMGLNHITNRNNDVMKVVNKSLVSDKGYFFNLITHHGTEGSKVIVKFKTKVNRNNMNAGFSGVTGIYYGIRSERAFYGFDNIGTPVAAKDGNASDWDGDKLSNEQEEKIDTNSYIKDTDNDGITDYNEYGNTDSVQGVVKNNYTDPTMPTPKLPFVNPSFTKGRVITGKTLPYKTVALVYYTDNYVQTGRDGSIRAHDVNNFGSRYLLADTIADKDGNYTLIVGRVMKREENQKYIDYYRKYDDGYGGNITFENDDNQRNRIPLYDNNYERYNDKKDGVTEFAIEVWSDGYDFDKEKSNGKVPKIYMFPVTIFIPNEKDNKYYERNIPDKIVVKDDTHLSDQDIEAIEKAIREKNTMPNIIINIENEKYKPQNVGRVTITYDDKSSQSDDIKNKPFKKI